MESDDDESTNNKKKYKTDRDVIIRNHDLTKEDNNRGKKRIQKTG